MSERDFIPGIYNYCDRWCERCAFTGRCRVYSMQEARGSSASADPQSAAFWEELKKIFQQTIDLVRQYAKEDGIDLDAAMSETVPVRLPSQGHRRLLRVARAYAKTADSWFKQNRKHLETKGTDLIAAAQADVPGTDPLDESTEIADALDVIQWYHVQIYVKLNRTSDAARDIDDQATSVGPTEITEEDLAERDGSAKVALIGVDRSIAAWGRLYQHLPDASDSILSILLELDRLRRRIEQAFPAARTFVRPGLDEV